MPRVICHLVVSEVNLLGPVPELRTRHLWRLQLEGTESPPENATMYLSGEGETAPFKAGERVRVLLEAEVT